MSGLLSGAVLLLALGSGLIAGVLWAFSSFIMRGLGQTPHGAEAMRALNVTAIPSSFILLFTALALASLVTVVVSLLGWQTPAAPWLFAGSVLYLIGVFGVTMVFNVPLNNELLAATPETLEGIWSNYLRAWTLWNHVRTVAGVASSLAFLIAFRVL